MRFIDGTRAELSGPVIVDPRVPGPPRAWIASAEEPLIELHGATVTIGRSPENDLVVGNDSTVSRLHAELLQHPDHWSVRDCRSRNGTYLNGERIEQATLRSGDVIRVGACEMLFTADDDVSSTTTAEDSEPAEV
jgi:pSer/pThr/pTyr-binding forkhead associated (FHA) protein